LTFPEEECQDADISGERDREEPGPPVSELRAALVFFRPEAPPMALPTGLSVNPLTFEDAVGAERH